MIEPGEDLTECQYQRKTAEEKEGVGLPDGPFVPECDPDGSFASAQCYWDECWCVLNPHGAEIQGTRVPQSEKHTLRCDEESGKKPPPTKEPTKSPPPKDNY